MFSVEGGTSLFDASGISILTFDDARTGKMFDRVSQMYKPERFIRYTNQGKMSPDSFLKDYQVERYLKLTELISNTINDGVMHLPGMQEMHQALEEHQHHGRDHLRRVEKNYKEEYKFQPLLRINWDFIKFSPSAYFAIRFHDLPEMHTGLKEHHDGAGAFFAYGILPKAYELVNQVVLDNGGIDFMSQHEWEKQRYATTFICLHHSKPETMPSVDQIVDNDGVLFDPMYVYKEAQRMADLVNMSLEDFFPGFAQIGDVIAAMRNGMIEEPIHFSRNEIIAIRDQTFAMAFADKMDSNRPSALSAARTFLVRPDRPLVSLFSKKRMSIQEEIRERILDGKGHESTDDISRFIFELTREPNWGNLPMGLRRDFMKSLYEKGKFMHTAVMSLLEGDFIPFTKAYDNIRRHIIEAALLKARVPVYEVKQILHTRDQDWYIDQAIKALNQRGFNGEAFIQSFLSSIQCEESNVQSAIREKHKKVQILNLNIEQKKRIQDILSSIVEWQRVQLLQYPPSFRTDPDWWNDGYYYIPLEKYRINH